MAHDDGPFNDSNFIQQSSVGWVPTKQDMVTDCCFNPYRDPSTKKLES